MDERGSKSPDTIVVEVAYARPDAQRLIELAVPAGTPLREVVRLSGVADIFTELDPATCPVGVFGRTVDDDYLPGAGDRVEIYRPLIVEPREARRARAANPD